MGELQKRIKEKAVYLDRTYDSKLIHQRDIFQIVEEMKKEFPTTEEIQMQLTMLSYFVTDKSVLEGLQEHLAKEYKATWKWLGER